MHTKNLKNEILFQVISATRNRDLLEQAPHDVYLDLAIVYFYMEEGADCRKRVLLFNNEQMRRYSVTKEELKEWAMVNTPRLLPVSFHSMEHVMREFQLWDSMGEGAQWAPMYVLSNVKMFLGSACLFYPKVLSSIRNTVQADFYILPSSIHECIILPMSDAYTKSELEKIVYEVNITQVPEQEILSNYVYIYQKSTQKFSK